MTFAGPDAAGAAGAWLAGKALRFVIVEASAAVVEACAWEQMAAAEAGAVFCSLCDGEGHGQPGYGPCPLEERGYWEARADEDREGFGW